MNKLVTLTVEMKQSRFTESQIIKALKENEQGRKAEEICRDLGIHKGTFYNWRKKYSGMDSLPLLSRYAVARTITKIVAMEK